MTSLPKPGGVQRHSPRGVSEVTISDYLALEERVDRQALLIQALVRLLLKKGAVTADEMKEWMEHVDMLDGAHDGKFRPAVGAVRCPSCDRVSRSSALKCQYCGAELPAQKLET
jgi:hypothetical protein